MFRRDASRPKRTGHQWPSSLPCLVCGALIGCDKALGSNTWGVAEDGTFFHARGNYGSTVFDPLSGCEYLEAVVCNACLKKHAQRVRIAEDMRRTVRWCKPLDRYLADEVRRIRKQRRDNGGHKS